MFKFLTQAVKVVLQVLGVVRKYEPIVTEVAKQADKELTKKAPK